MEDVLKNSIRNEAKLIGYNEEPIDVGDLSGLDVENLKLEEAFGEDPDTESKNSETGSTYFIRRGLPQAPSVKEDRLPQKSIREAGIWMDNVEVKRLNINSCLFIRRL